MKRIDQILSEPKIRINEIGYDGGILIYKDSKYEYLIIFSIGGGWDHVSISCRNKKIMPTWDLMTKIKEIFFEDEEVVMQLHPKKTQYVNLSTNCLHLWRPQNQTIPTPPIYFV